LLNNRELTTLDKDAIIKNAQQWRDKIQAD